MSAAEKRSQAAAARAQERATKYGGSVLIPEGLLIKTSSSIIWTCHRGHKWTNSIKSMEDKNTWCQICTANFDQKIISYILNKIYGNEYIFKSQKVDALKLVCSVANLDLKICINISPNDNPSHKDILEKSGIKYLHLKPFGLDNYPEVAEQICKFTSKEVEGTLPTTIEITDHFFRMMESEVDQVVTKKGGKLLSFDYTNRKLPTIDVLCSVCKDKSKKWCYDDIVRTDPKRSAKLICDNCCHTKPKGEEALKEKYSKDGFETLGFEPKDMGGRKRKFVNLKCKQSEIVISLAQDNYSRMKGCPCHVCRGNSRYCSCEECKK